MDPVLHRIDVQGTRIGGFFGTDPTKDLSRPSAAARNGADSVDAGEHQQLSEQWQADAHETRNGADSVDAGDEEDPQGTLPVSVWSADGTTMAIHHMSLKQKQHQLVDLNDGQPPEKLCFKQTFLKGLTHPANHTPFNQRIARFSAEVQPVVQRGGVAPTEVRTCMYACM